MFQKTKQKGLINNFNPLNIHYNTYLFIGHKVYQKMHEQPISI